MKEGSKVFEYDVCVVGGCGHVGLPLGMSFAKAGKKVVLYDINSKNVDNVNKGKMPFKEDGEQMSCSLR